MFKNITLPPINVKENVAQLQANLKILPGKIAHLGQKVPIPLLLVTAFAFVGSGYGAFKLGDIALKGVSSPEINPAQKLVNKPTQQAGDTQPLKTFQPLNIQTVEKQVNSYIASQQKSTKPPAKGKANPSAKGTKADSKVQPSKKSAN